MNQQRIIDWIIKVFALIGSAYMVYQFLTVLDEFARGL